MRILGAIVLAAALAAPAGAQSQAQPQRPQESQKQVGTAGAAATVNAIVDNPERFYNESVNLSAEVGEVFGKKAFNLQEEGMIDRDDRLLVLSDEDVRNLTEDSIVEIRGKVRPFVKSELERELGISDWTAYGFDADFFSKHERKPVLIADSVQVKPSREKDEK
jgi:hypothetical protein